MSQVGDLGRRVAERRRALGLTVDELATRSGMSPTYVRAVESSPSPQPSRAALWRLAAALETSVDIITGGGMEAPPGRTDPSDRPTLEPLTIGECEALIAPGGVGRVVFSDERGPVALPVNFRVSEGDIVFRTEPNAGFVTSLATGDVSFEVDHLDETLTEGWSVLLTGKSHVIVDPGEVRRAQSLAIVPWAAGDRDAYVCLVPREITGRRIRKRSGGG
ncbi:MAG: pyridoxamine 5'-phosphate oxidase family protein [Acidimicrobiales bacterium]|jgi:transcriptional regulator with XRE-family HTH domain